MLHARVYGLRIRSDVPIDGLAPSESFDDFDCDVRRGHVAIPRDAIELDATWLDDEPGARVFRDGNAFVFVYRDDTRFRIDDARTITTSWVTTAEDMATYLLGPILALILRLRGTLALHASAIVMNDTVLLFAGAAGAGKSTTAAAFVARGASMLTDDVGALAWRDGVPHVLPGYPRLRLWSDSASALYGSAEALPLLTPTWEKRYTTATLAPAALPLRALCILAGRDGETRVRRLTGHEAVMAALVRTSMTHLLDDAQRARELEQVASLVAGVPVFEVLVRNALDAVGELPDAIAAALS